MDGEERLAQENYIALFMENHRYRFYILLVHRKVLFNTLIRISLLRFRVKMGYTHFAINKTNYTDTYTTHSQNFSLLHDS